MKIFCKVCLKKFNPLPYQKYCSKKCKRKAIKELGFYRKQFEIVVRILRGLNENKNRRTKTKGS